MVRVCNLQAGALDENLKGSRVDGEELYATCGSCRWDCRVIKVIGMRVERLRGRVINVSREWSDRVTTASELRVGVIVRWLVGFIAWITACIT